MAGPGNVFGLQLNFSFGPSSFINFYPSVIYRPMIFFLFCKTQNMTYIFISLMKCKYLNCHTIIIHEITILYQKLKTKTKKLKRKFNNMRTREETNRILIEFWFPFVFLFIISTLPFPLFKKRVWGQTSFEFRKYEKESNVLNR